MLASLQEQQESPTNALSHPTDSSHPPPALPATNAMHPVTSQDSHIFAGTSQEYQQLPTELPTKPTPLVACQPDALTNIPNLAQSNRLPYEQLEALYAAQKRKIKELEESANVFHQETEREV